MTLTELSTPMGKVRPDQQGRPEPIAEGVHLVQLVAGTPADVAKLTQFCGALGDDPAAGLDLLLDLYERAGARGGR